MEDEDCLSGKKKFMRSMEKIERINAERISSAFSDGFNDGYREGYDVGFEEGYFRGFNEGRLEGRREFDEGAGGC